MSQGASMFTSIPRWSPCAGLRVRCADVLPQPSVNAAATAVAHRASFRRMRQGDYFSASNSRCGWSRGNSRRWLQVSTSTHFHTSRCDAFPIVDRTLIVEGRASVRRTPSMEESAQQLYQAWYMRGEAHVWLWLAGSHEHCTPCLERACCPAADGDLRCWEFAEDW